MKPTKVAVIVDLPTPTSMCEPRDALGHTSYYNKIIHNYVILAAPLEKLLKKEAQFVWTEECQKYFEQLKGKLVLAPIFIFLDWKQFFHVHVDATIFALRIVLARLGGNLDHPKSFSSRKFLDIEKQFTITKTEGLAMVYLL